MLTVYGLKNCDTCKKARKWLDANSIEYTFKDVRADGIAADQVATWAQAVGWEVLLNKRGTTWRALPAEDTSDVTEAKAIELMVAHPALIKRPVFLHGDSVSVGFGKKEQAALSDALGVVG